MVFRNIRSILLTLLCLETCSAITESTGVHPIVQDWSAAVNDDGFVRIPLQNPRGHAWYASLQMGSPLQYEQICVLDNNHALSMVFSKYCKNCPHKVYDKKYSSSFVPHYSRPQQVEDDGFVVSGGVASDFMCVGQYGNTAAIYKDPYTTVCLHEQAFFLVDKQIDWNWSSKANDVQNIDSVCGLGKEKNHNEMTEGWLARAVHYGLIKNNSYTIQLVPQKLSYVWPGSVPVRKYDEFKERMLRTSFLTLGGWSEDDYTGDIVWFNTTEGNGWNQTASGLRFGNTEIVGGQEQATAMFETGYPYIGLSEPFYDQVADILTREVEGMECTKGQHWGICRVPEKNCESIDLDYELAVKIDNYDFTIPIKNIATYVNQTNTFYCQTQIALAQHSENTIILGGAFFTAFLGIFDVDNDKVGLANSARALDGSYITCSGTSCPAFSTVSPSLLPSGKSILVLVLTSVVIAVAILLCICVCKVKKRRKLKRDAQLVHQFIEGTRTPGYTLNDEKEDDPDSEESDTIKLDMERENSTL